MSELEYMPVREAAEFAGGVGDGTVRRWMKEGLPFIKPRDGRNSKVLIKKADLVAFLEKHRTKTEATATEAHDA